MRAIGLFSGGLDSILAAELMRRHGIEVVALSFFTPFFDSSRAERAASQLGLALTLLDITDDFLAMLPRPRYGHGANFNPCIDCKALMFRQAGRLMKTLNAEFIFSGEVLGQRPMSQNKQSLHVVSKLSGYEDHIVRPLSAKLLPPPLVQREGRLPAGVLHDISGRGRKRQMQLAQDLNIASYPSTGGGCKLTEPNFARRIKRLYQISPAPSVREIELLKVGRHVRLSDCVTLIVGRNELENERIENLALPSDTLLRVSRFVGPTGLLTAPCDRDMLLAAASIVAGYSDAPAGPQVTVLASQAEQENELLVAPLERREVTSLLI